jgi:hypothetical protein
MAGGGGAQRSVWHTWRRLGRWRPIVPWRLSGLITGGRALTANRGPPFPFKALSEWMAVGLNEPGAVGPDQVWSRTSLSAPFELKALFIAIDHANT